MCPSRVRNWKDTSPGQYDLCESKEVNQHYLLVPFEQRKKKGMKAATSVRLSRNLAGALKRKPLH